MNESCRLIDRKELIKRHPALGERKYRLDWLLRTRQIPCVIVGKRRIFFDEAEIEKWIKQHRVEGRNGY